MKQLFCHLAALILSLSIWTSAAAFSVDGLNYSVEDGVATLLGATSRNITSVSIPASVTYNGANYPVNFIQHDAFDNYSSLRYVRFEESETYISCPWYVSSAGIYGHSSPFENCPIEEYYFGRSQGVLVDDSSVYGDYVMLATTASEIKVTFAGKTKYIISSQINDIFKNKLTTLTIGGDIVEIASKAFSNCANLKKITLLDGSYTLPSNTFPSTGIDTLILSGTQFKNLPYQYPKHVTFGEGWDSIPEKFVNRFAPNVRNDYPTSVTLPSTLKKICSYAFYGCKTLKSINFPDSLTHIDNYAFTYCDELTDLVLGKGVEKIGYEAFGRCKSLTSVFIPASVDSIASCAFSYCSKLSKVVFEQSNLSIELNNHAFSGIELDSLIINRVLPNIGGSEPKHVVFGEGLGDIPEKFFIIVPL